ncbi:hypothetical protein N7509_006153 [Penicillium cosmopolitanum]|uniref:Uncharacterized protein n=1 Tax=Penicillium cosmopolitanum TaxID=1131564 RepID=A0A9X0BAR1_9EURO|nr:uncharacterized protein N7509_006153 [Penicillium cosmopolitanum]KAJ5398040.1 hypothetical protein N7509_006153 [Penicillium cosmopolitanum]
MVFIILTLPERRQSPLGLTGGPGRASTRTHVTPPAEAVCDSAEAHPNSLIIATKLGIVFPAPSGRRGAPHRLAESS